MALLGVRDFLTVVTVVGVVLVTVLLIGAGFKEEAISDAVLLMLSCSACGSSSNQCDSHSASGAFMAFFIVTVDLRKPSVSARSIFSARSSALISLRSWLAVLILMFCPVLLLVDEIGCVNLFADDALCCAAPINNHVKSVCVHQ